MSNNNAPDVVHVKLTEGYAHNWWGIVTDCVDEDGVEYVRADLVPAPAVPDDVAAVVARLRRHAKEATGSAHDAMLEAADLLDAHTAAQPAPDAVAEAQLVDAIGSSIFGRHERGFVLWPLIEGDELKAGIRAALTKGSRP